MHRIALAVLVATALPAVAPAADYVLIWDGPIDNGITTRIPDFFAGPDGEANAGLHLVIGDRPEWDACTRRIDLGEIQRQDAAGQVTFDIGPLIEHPPFYAYFVRGDEHQVHAVHEIAYRPDDGRPILPTATETDTDPGPPGAPGQPHIGGGGQ